MSSADLGMGIRGCIQSGQEWPPSLPVFRAYCRPAKREHAAMYEFPPSRQLPHKLSDEDRQKGREAIAAMKRGLNA